MGRGRDDYKTVAGAVKQRLLPQDQVAVFTYNRATYVGDAIGTADRRIF